jgi:hypothetical protein
MQNIPWADNLATEKNKRLMAWDTQHVLSVWNLEVLTMVAIRETGPF